MDTLTFVAVSLVAIAVIALAWMAGRQSRAEAAQRRAEERAEEPPEAVRHLPVAGESRNCRTCRFWDWEGGQSLVAGNPAFAQATGFIPPWQMGRKRKVKENPEYLALEEKLQAAIAAEDHALQRELHERLMKMSPGEVLPDTEQAPKGMLGLEWGHLGACREHNELRFRSDQCDKWTPALEVAS